MGRILIVMKTAHGVREWTGPAEDVASFFSRDNIGATISAGAKDREEGTITVDAEKGTIVLDTDSFVPSRETVRFWNCLGFEVLEKLKGDREAS